MKTETPRPILLKDYRPPNYLIDHVDLDVSLVPERTRVSARLNAAQSGASTGSPGRCDWTENAGAGDRAARRPPALARRLHQHRQGARDRQAAHPRLCLGDPHLLQPRKPTRHLSGLYRSRGIYCTQCEAQGFRRITYFLDRPDVLATYDARLEARRATSNSVLLSNAAIRSSTVGSTVASAILPSGAIRILAELPARPRRRRPDVLGLRLRDRLGPESCPPKSTSNLAKRPLRLGPWTRQRAMRWDERTVRARLRS
mgnify:CR=1 FL=1